MTKTSHQKTGYQKGLQAENLAALYMRLKGYRILAKRYKTPVGEIDLVARRGKTVVFVEVKARAKDTDAAEAIHIHNQTRVRRAAELYLQKYPRYTTHDIRFDAVLLSKGRWPRHIVAAF